MLKKLGLTLLIAGLSIGAALAQDATPAPLPLPQAEASVTGGDEDALRAFILRYVVGNSQGQSVNISIGALPTDLPFSVTTPASVTLYGTVTRAGEGTNPSFYDVAFDTGDAPQALIDFYKQAFSGADWMVTNESVSPPSAFSGQTSAYASFCYQQGVATVNVNAYNEGRGVTNVNLNIQVPGDVYTCSSQQAPINDPVMSLIPSLALPEGVILKSNMGGGFSYYTPMGRSNSVGAILETTRPLADIANDYNAQLAAAGWQAVFSESSEHSALSTWTLSDEAGKTWHGSLLIVADNEANVYNALIYIEE
jgi:hypothetical protein